ncbi:HAUS augmin-like complex subunit 3 [Trichoplax sp. H2]|nr:HAUS augmin-like complex subunit 3 [Trichoplax sp. H2]|eukprot:RDD43661.1 HAUS augmin-like complex subunit 3 [Trichoplax sp. H2]
MMAAHQVIDKLLTNLTKLGCPIGQKLQPASLEWLFEEDSMLSFLAWLADSVDNNNVLSPEEKDRFEKLVTEKGEKVLRGRDLEAALQTIDQTDQETQIDESEDLLRADLHALRKEIATAKAYKAKIINHRNALNIHQISLSHKLDPLVDLNNLKRQENNNIAQENEEANKKVNKSLQMITQNVRSLAQLYDADNPPFLYQQSLSDYHASTEKFLRTLTNFIKKQFFEGISEIVGPENESYYQLLDINNPLEELLRGKSEERYSQERQELSRLQQIYPLSKLQQIKAKARLSGIQSAINFAKVQLGSHEFLLQRNVVFLRQLEKEKSEILHQIRDDINTIQSTSLSNALKREARLIDTPILRGDYDLKIARQNYFTSKQDEVINKLMFLRSCEQFLSMALEIEAKKLRDCHRLLLSVHTLIDEDTKVTNDRIEFLANIAGITIKSPRNTIDNRDLFFTRIYNVLNPSNTKQEEPNAFITYASLVDAVGNLNRLVSSFSVALTSFESHNEEKLRRCLLSCTSLEDKIFSGNRTTKNLQLSPKQILDNLTEIEELLLSLEKTLKEIISDFDKKKKVLQADQYVAFERRIFVLFLTDSNQLQKYVAELKERVAAQRII